MAKAIAPFPPQTGERHPHALIHQHQHPLQIPSDTTAERRRKEMIASEGMRADKGLLKCAEFFKPFSFFLSLSVTASLSLATHTHAHTVPFP